MVVNTGEDEDQIMEEEMPSAQPQATPKDEQAIPPSQNVQASQELSQTQQRIAQDIPRLMITKIENHNFKSYAGTQVLGPFHKVCNFRFGLQYIRVECEYKSWH